MKIITDEQLDSFPMRSAIEAIQSFFESAKDGHVVSPPRHTVAAGSGALTFTIGAELNRTKTIGFRVYDTYPGRDGTNTEQIVAVYSTEVSKLKGIVIGSKIGAIRTAAINGFAISIMAKSEVEAACIIGAGHHAYYQLKALLAVRHPKKIYVCNRTLSKAELLVQKMRQEYGYPFIVSEDIENTVRVCDIVLCASSSPTPVIESSWLKDGAYISSIGPKFKNRHELPTDIQSGASIMVSDAPQQLAAYTSGYFLEDTSSIQSLESVAAKTNKQGYSVFLSTGRSGTEVVVADRIIDFVYPKADS